MMKMLLVISVLSIQTALWAIWGILREIRTELILQGVGAQKVSPAVLKSLYGIAKARPQEIDATGVSHVPDVDHG